MNAGSLVDFLKTKPGIELKKGWFFGYGGSSNKDIQAAFDKVFPVDKAYKAKLDEVKKSFVHMTYLKDPIITEYSKKDSSDDYSAFANSDKPTILASNNNPEIVEGIFLATIKKKNFVYNSVNPDDLVLHICLDDEKLNQEVKGLDIHDPHDWEKYCEAAKADAKKILAPLLEQAIEKLVELGLKMPSHFCCDYDADYQGKVVTEWQKLNGAA